MIREFPQPLSAVWFDLDGTLIDSAPDLYEALRDMCREHDRPVPDYATFRPLVSRGGKAMLRLCFRTKSEPDIDLLLPRFLEIYRSRQDRLTRLFDGVQALLQMLDARGVPWGVVTNKAGFLAEPLLRRLELSDRAAAVVCGDTLAVNKPDPAPLLHACALAGVHAAHSIYVGDDARDIQAARAAGMFSVAAGWGYLDGGHPEQWGSDCVVDDVAQLARLIG